MTAEPGAARGPVPPRGGRGLTHLAIAAGVALVVLGADVVTGKHVLKTLDALAGRFNVWFDERRTPGDSCSPSAPGPFRSIQGIVLDVPACWQEEVSAFLGREVHRFHDPDAKAGTFSVSVEPVSNDDDRKVLLAELEVLSAKPGAVVDGIARSAENGPGGEAAVDLDGSAKGSRPVTGSLAERVEHEAGYGPASDLDGSAKGSRPVSGSLAERVHREVQGGGTSAPTGHTAAAGPGAGSAAAKPDALPPSVWIHTVRTRGEVGATAQAAWGAGPTDAAYTRSVWTWLLIGDHSAVRAVYSVRTSWTNDSTVVDEFQTVRKVVESIRPAP